MPSWKQISEDSPWLRGPEGKAIVTRRRVLVGAGGVLTTHLFGCGSDGQTPGQNVPHPTSDAGANPMTPDGMSIDCVMRAEQTEGPFAEDDHPQRADLRGNKPGIPLRLVLRLGRIEGAMCTPFEAAVVDIWQCDAAGVYSGPKAALEGQDFLRGYQLTDKSGTVEFLTICPGSYPGRPVHIHFSVRLEHGGSIRRSDAATFVSQLYFPEDLSADLLRDPAYQASAPLSRNAAADIPWILKMEQDGSGYRGQLDIGVQIA